MAACRSANRPIRQPTPTHQDAYFAITSGEDGTKVQQLTKEELLSLLNTEYWGPVDYLDKVPAQDKGCFTGCGENPMLIIKGEIVRPREIKTVVELDID